MYRALVLLLAATALTSGAAASAATRPSAKPALQLTKRSPLTIQGVRFKTLERVRVTASTDAATAVRTTRTSRTGTFTVDFGAFQLDQCGATTIQARGASGDRATLVVTPHPPIDGPCRPV